MSEGTNADLSPRSGIKRPKINATKLTKSPSAISTPPKAAIASPKAKDGLHRHKKVFGDMLHMRSRKEPESESVKSEKHVEKAIVRSSQEKARNEDVVVSDSDENVHLMQVAELERSLNIALIEQQALRDSLARALEQLPAQDEDARPDEHYTSRQEDLADSDCPKKPLSADGSKFVRNMQSPPGEEIGLTHSSDAANERLVLQNQELQSQISHLQKRLAQTEALYQSRMDTVISRLHIAEKEAQQRAAQLLSLKSTISSLTRVEPQLSDGEISKQFSQLADRIREWTVSNFRKAKLTSEIPEDVRHVLSQVTPHSTLINVVDRLAFFQAIISKAIEPIFCENFIVGLPDHMRSLSKLSLMLDLSKPDFHVWRRTTLRCLHGTEAGRLIDDEQEKVVQALSNSICTTLFRLTSTTGSQHVFSALQSIIADTIAFQVQVSHQKARYQIDYLHNDAGQHLKFDDRVMDSVNEGSGSEDDDEYENSLASHRFDFCVFPALQKFGDEFGGHAELSNLLVKARVCTSPVRMDDHHSDTPA